MWFSGPPSTAENVVVRPSTAENVVLRPPTAENVVVRGSSCCALKAITSFVWWPYFPQTDRPLMPECVRQGSSGETKDSSDDQLWLQDPQTVFPNLPTHFLSLPLKVRLRVQLCWVSQPYPDPLPSSLTRVFLLKQSFPVESRLVCFSKGASWNLLLSEPRRTQASLCLSTSMQESMSVCFSRGGAVLHQMRSWGSINSGRGKKSLQLSGDSFSLLGP